MTRDDAKVLWPIIKGWAEGGVIQLNCGTSRNPQWKTQSQLDFGAGADNYRLKPTPKVRAFTAEELPALVAERRVVRAKGRVDCAHLVIAACSGKVTLTAVNGSSTLPLYSEELLNSWEFIDGSPCGVVEE